MANWETKVLLTDLHEGYQKGEMDIHEVGQKLADRLDKNRYTLELAEVSEQLREVDDSDDYDSLLEQLYDFGDYDHRIWFETF